MKSKIRIRKDENGKTFAIITNKLISKDEKKEIALKRDEVLQKKLNKTVTT